MTVMYEIGDNLYLNITNKCPCACIFCIRKNGDGAYGSDSLWLEHEPSAEEVISELERTNLKQYKEIVFCGFGEPLERLDTVIEISRYLKKKDMYVRLNTNGLADIIHGIPTAHMLKGLIDTVSISLNAGTEKEYMRVTQPKFRNGAFEAVQRFAQDCKKYVPEIIFTVVDVISEEEIQQAQAIADKLEVPLRVRRYDG